MLRRRSKHKTPEGAGADLVVVGLGNPGAKYEGTRHNVGVAVVHVLAERYGDRFRKTKELSVVDEVRIASKRVVLALPTTFMNESGQAVGRLVARHHLDDLAKLVIVHDELDLPVGRFKVKFDGGLAGHNGLKSIRDHVHTEAFTRVRVGVGRPSGSQRGADYVLKRPSKAEQTELEVVFREAADAVETILSDGVGAAMTQYNAG